VHESPRWLLVHGRARRAEAIVAAIERDIGGELPDPGGTVRVRQRRSTAISTVVRTVVRENPRLALLALALMVSQAFFYNAIFYTHRIVLTDYYGVSGDDVGGYLVPLAAPTSPARSCSGASSTAGAVGRC
jgi:hypothetical protein